MPFQTLLAVLTDNEGDAAVLEAAHAVACYFKSHVDVLFMGELPRPLPYLNTGVAPGFIATVVDDAEAAVRVQRDRAHNTFNHWMSLHGLCDRSFQECGPPSVLLTASWVEWAGSRKQLGVQGRYTDLIVMARPASATVADSGLMLGGEIVSALFDSARPVLFVPADWKAFSYPQEWGGMVAWNGSSQAARAVGYGIPFLSAAKGVTVLSGTEPDKPSQAGLRELNDIRRYLSLQGIHASFRQPTVRSRDAGKAILAEALACHAELIVMGAFTHSRVCELVLGGATQHVLSHSPVPILMAH